MVEIQGVSEQAVCICAFFPTTPTQQQSYRCVFETGMISVLSYSLHLQQDGKFKNQRTE